MFVTLHFNPKVQRFQLTNMTYEYKVNQGNIFLEPVYSLKSQLHFYVLTQ